MKELGLNEILAYAGGLARDAIPVFEFSKAELDGFDPLMVEGRLTLDGYPLGRLTLEKDIDTGEWTAKIIVRSEGAVKKATLPYRGAWLWLLEAEGERRRPLYARGTRRKPQAPKPKAERRPVRRRVVRAAS